MARKDNIKNATTNFRKRWEFTTADGMNHVAMVSNTNVLMFTDDIHVDNYVNGSAVFTLPEDLRPASPITMVLPLTYTNASGSSTPQRIMTIGTDGKVSVNGSYTYANMHFNGLCINLNSRYYQADNS